MQFNLEDSTARLEQIPPGTIIMLRLLLLLMVPMRVLSNIQIDIRAALKNEDVSVDFFGEDVAPISFTEESIFQVYEEKLKDAVETFFGKRPDEAYVREATTMVFYRRYGFHEIQRILTPKSARILRVTTKPVLISEQELRNNGSVTGTFNAGMSHNLETTASTTWTTGGELSVGHDISVGISFGVAQASSTTRMSYTANWGRNMETSKSVTVGTTSGVEIELKPGEVAHAHLSATLGTLEVEVKYTATLRGQVAVSYYKRYKDHHYWAFDVRSIQNAAGLPISIDTKSVIKIGFYSNAKVEIR